MPEPIHYFWSIQDDAERWNGAFASSDDAVKDCLAEEKDLLDQDGPSIIYVATGEELKPWKLVDASDILDRIDDNPEDCPIDEGWKDYWGCSYADIAELTQAIEAAFEAWTTRKKLRKYYTVDSGDAVPIDAKTWSPTAPANPPSEVKPLASNETKESR